MGIKATTLPAISLLLIFSSCSHDPAVAEESPVRQAPYSLVEIPSTETYYSANTGKSGDMESQPTGEGCLWPVSGQKRGESILMAPDEILYNDRTGEREPFGGLVIGGELGTEILAPEKGKIDKIIPYFSFSDTPYSEEMSTYEYMTDMRRYVRSGSVEMTFDDGSAMAIRGLILLEELSAGQTVEKGQVLGYLNYYFVFIPKPSIYVEFPGEQDNREIFFADKNRAVQLMTGQDYGLDALYRQVRNDLSAPLSDYYYEEQPRSVIKDERTLYREEMIWPVKGGKTGTNIIMTPGEDRIYSWPQSSCNVLRALMIAGNLGDEIVSSIEGTVRYSPDQYSLFPTPYDMYSGDQREMEETLKNSGLPVKWALGGDVCIEQDDGRAVSYTGVVPAEGIVEGAKISKGDLIGTMAYSYLFIPEPSVAVGIHVPDTKGFRDYYDKINDFWLELTGRNYGLSALYDLYMSDGPESQKPFDNPLFALRRSIAPLREEEDFYKPHTKEALERDFAQLRDSLLKYHPDIYRFIDEKNLEELFDKTSSDLHEGMTSLEFHKVCYPIIQEIKGDHLFLDIAVPAEKYLYLPLALRVVDDKLYVTAHSAKSPPDLRGKFPVGAEIIEMDGKPAEKAIKEAKRLLFTPDGGTRAFERYEMRGSFFYLYSQYHLEDLHLKGSLTLKGSSGSEVLVKLSDSYSPFPDVKGSNKVEFTYLTMGEREVGYYCPRGIGDYSGILDSKIPEMKEKGIDNLILDLRNNPGGNGPTAERIFSMFHGEPFSYELDCSVMDPELTDMAIEELHTREGKRGYWTNIDESAVSIEPSEIQFTGNVYILTNPYTLSAAGTLAYLFKQFGRGILIGQASGTPEGWINAKQYFRTTLPETGLNLRIPLVHTRYIKRDEDGIINPDYEIGISMEDFLSFPEEERIWDRLWERKALGVIEKLISGN